mgnify:CR=1 FL=1
MKKKVTLQRMGTKRMTRRKSSKTLTPEQRYLKKKKAMEEFRRWFK